MRITSHLVPLLAMLLACSESDFASSGRANSAAGNGRADAGQEDADGNDDDTESNDDDDDDDDNDGGGESGEDSGRDDEGNDDDLDLGRDGGLDSDIEVDEELAKLPGVEVVRAGVNFEDSPSGDNDKNDAVLCFEGKFKVDSGSGDVTSLAKQTVTVSTFSSSGCKHDVRVEVHHDDGSKEAPITFRSNSGQTLSLKFKKKSKLEVFMKTVEGSCPKIEYDMHNAQMCQVAADVCRNQGG